MTEPIIIARVIQTCLACPSQWDAWTPDGQYLYLRYRFGIGTVETHDSPDVDTWDLIDDAVLLEFGDGLASNNYDCEIGLEEFCERAGLLLADDVQRTGN